MPNRLLGMVWASAVWCIETEVDVCIITSYHIYAYLYLVVFPCLFRYQPLWGQKLLPWNQPLKTSRCRHLLIVPRPGWRMPWRWRKTSAEPRDQILCDKVKKKSDQNGVAASWMSSPVCSVKHIEYEYLERVDKICNLSAVRSVFVCLRAWVVKQSPKPSIKQGWRCLFTPALLWKHASGSMAAGLLTTFQETSGTQIYTNTPANRKWIGVCPCIFIRCTLIVAWMLTSDQRPNNSSSKIEMTPTTYHWPSEISKWLPSNTGIASISILYPVVLFLFLIVDYCGNICKQYIGVRYLFAHLFHVPSTSQAMHEVVRGGDVVREKVERGCAEAGGRYTQLLFGIVGSMMPKLT